VFEFSENQLQECIWTSLDWLHVRTAEEKRNWKFSGAN